MKANGPLRGVRYAHNSRISAVVACHSRKHMLKFAMSLGLYVGSRKKRCSLLVDFADDSVEIAGPLLVPCRCPQTNPRRREKGDRTERGTGSAAARFPRAPAYAFMSIPLLRTHLSLRKYDRQDSILPRKIVTQFPPQFRRRGHSFLSRQRNERRCTCRPAYLGRHRCLRSKQVAEGR